MFPTYVDGTANHARTCFTTVHAEHPPRFAFLARVTTLHDPFVTLSLSPLENVAPFAPSKAPPPSVNLFKRRSCIPYPDFFFLNCVRRLSFPFSLLIVLLYQIYPYPDFFFLNCVHRLFFPFSLLIVLLYQIYHIFAIIFGKMSLDRLKYFIVIRFKKKKIINGTIYSIYM